MPFYRRTVAAVVILTFVFASSAVFAADTTFSSHSRPYFAAARVGTGYDFSPGFHWELDAGFGADFEVIVPFRSRFAVQLMYSRGGMHAPEDMVYWDTAYTTYSSTVKYENSRWLVGLRYTTKNGFLGVKWLDDYWYAAAGDIDQEYGGNLFARHNSSGDDYIITLGYHPITDFAVAFGFGLLYQISQRFAVDARLDRLLVFDEFRTDDPDKSCWNLGQTLSVRAGLTAMLPLPD